MQNYLHRIKFSFLFFLISLFLINQITLAQSPKTLAKADLSFQSGEYYTAASLYEQYIQPASTNKTNEGLTVYRHIGSGNKKSKNNTSVSKMDVVLKMAHSYRLSYYFAEAIKYYEQCLQTDPKKYRETLYWIAVCKKQLGFLSEAKHTIDLYINEAVANDPFLAAAKQEQQTLIFIEKERRRPDTALFVINKADLGSSAKGNYALAGTINNQWILTGVLQNEKAGEGKNPYNNRLFTATVYDKTVQAGQPVIIEGLNLTANQVSGTYGKNGNILYFAQRNIENGKSISQIYYSTKSSSGNWSTPILLPSINEQGANQKHPSVTEDGSFIFFTSDRSGGYGKYDIWYAPLDSNGLPGAVKNAGKEVNTTGDEVSPFYHPLSKTLVYSSDGREGMGGFDFFLATGDAGAWTKSENAGYPVNSSRDDLFFFTTGKKLMQNVFFSSDRGSDCCLEIYHLEKLPKKKIVSGKLSDCKTGNPLDSVTLSIAGVKDLRTAKDGGFRFEAEEDFSNQVDIKLERAGYTVKTLKVKLTADESNPLITQLTSEPLCLERIPVKVVKREEVSYVNFDFNKSDLLNSNIPILDSFYIVMQQNPTYTIKIDAHTDSKGTEKYNMNLSNKRANAVANYFIKRGIDRSRLLFEGFGKCCPLEPEVVNGKYDKNAAARNRRALITISKD